METGYLHWAKTHRRVRYELTNSGVPAASIDDIGASSEPIDIVVRGPYGHPSLIERIAEKYALGTERIVPVLGASCGIFLSLGATIQRGDRVALESPCYDPVMRAATFVGANVVPIIRKPNDLFCVQLHEIAAQLRDGARVVFLTNLHNPSGQLADRETMCEVANLCARHNSTLIVDEVYLDAAHLNLQKPRWSAAQLGDNVVAINSLTKIHGIGGIRCGWIVAREGIVDRVREVANLVHGDNPAPSEALAIRGFTALTTLEERFRRFYRDAQPVFRAWLASESLLSGYASAGALFEFVKLPAGVSSKELNQKLVTHYDTQVVPGRFFGLDDHIRITIALPPAALAEALNRISEATRSLVA